MPAPLLVTATEVQMKIAEPNKFKVEDYVQQMAKKTGVPVENVKVKSREMSMSVGYSFKGDAKVSKEQAEFAIAKSLDIDQSQVSVEILTRRLKDQLRGRKLGEETRIKATITMDANDEAEIEKAQAAHEKLADSKKSADMLKNVKKVLSEEANIVIDVPEVTEVPQVEVKVETEIVAVSETPVELPTGADLQEIAEKAGATDIEVGEVKTLTMPPVVFFGSTTTTTASETDATAPSTTSTTTSANTSTTEAAADKFVSQGSINLTMSVEDVTELTNDLEKAKKVLGKAIASAAGVEASAVTVTEVYVNGERQERRLSTGAEVIESSIDVEFLIVSATPPPASLKDSELRAAIESEAQAEGITVNVRDVKSSIVNVSSPPAPAKPDEDSDSSFVTIFLGILFGVTGVGMIGGFVYWYLTYSQQKGFRYWSTDGGRNAGADNAQHDHSV